jgi:hypothetical protein
VRSDTLRFHQEDEEKYMTKRRSILIGGAILAAGLLWYLFRPEALIISKRVNEPFPGAEPTLSSIAESPDTAQSSRVNTSAMTPPSDQVGRVEPVKLATGQFHSNAHETKGIATIYRLDNGRLALRLTQFSTSNGPDVRVYLVAAADVNDEAVAKRAGVVDLGPMKGNVGDQNYELPAGVDLTNYRAVSIWCRRFSVNFGAAPLSDVM